MSYIDDESFPPTPKMNPSAQVFSPFGGRSQPIHPRGASFIDDLFSPYYDDWIRKAFTLRANDMTEAYPLLQHIYNNNPTQFTLLYGLHHKDRTDDFHFSIGFDGYYQSYRIHICGYWRGGFKITHLTYTSRYGSNQPTELSQLAKFAEYDYKYVPKSERDGVSETA